MRKEKPTLEIGLQLVNWLQFLAFNIGIKYVFIPQMRKEKPTLEIGLQLVYWVQSILSIQHRD
jgi:hypothetical protein